MDEIQIIYTSKARRDFDTAELKRILTTAVNNNARKNITGMLLYTQQTFMQVLEGETGAIETLLSRIKADPRHHSVEVVLRTAIWEREFKNWSMGFKQLDQASVRDLPHFAPFFEAGFDAEKICSQPGISLEILRALSSSLKPA